MPYDHALRLAYELNKVCPLVGCSLHGFEPAPIATPAQISAAQSVFNSFVPSDSAYEQWLVSRPREQAQSALESAKSESFAVDRALALVLLEELNRLRTWNRDLKAAVAGATNFASLQTRVAALPNTPDYTRVQLMNVIKGKLADGSAD